MLLPTSEHLRVNKHILIIIVLGYFSENAVRKGIFFNSFFRAVP